MMPLQNRLNQRKTDFKKNAPAEAVSLMTKATDDLTNSGILDHVLKKGDAAPEFTLIDQDGKQVSSIRLLKSGPMVIHFFRGGW